MWKLPLNPRLKDISDRSGKVLKYVPATHIRDLGLRHLGFPEDVLLIRHEYISALEELTSRSSDQARGDGVYVTGHPGIGMAWSLYATVFSHHHPDPGKSCFLFYVLLVRLSGGQPTALQTSENTFVVFKVTGAEVRDVSARGPDVIPPGAWALSHSTSTPRDTFLGASGLGSWIVQATPPLNLRWHEWDEQCSMTKYVLDYFSSDELCTLGSVHFSNSKPICTC